MGTALIAPGRAMLFAPGRPALWRALPGSGGGGAGGSFSGPYPNAITGLSGWWDAGTPAGLLDSGGRALPAWNNAVSGVADKSGAGNMLAAYRVTGNTLPQATPRLNGFLGGVGLNTIVPPAMPSAAGVYLPLLDPDSGLSLASADLGSASAWTWYLVWSRPNLRQGVSGPVSLLTIGGVSVLQMDATSLILFPGAGQAVLAPAMERRHTHSVVIRNTPGGGVDVWLDGAQAATSVANPLGSVASGPLLLLHSGIGQGCAQCWFHEAACWPRALASAEITTLLACATRWQRGTRKGVTLLFTGQSNAVNYTLADGAGHLLAQGVAWYLGALAYNVFAAHGVSSWTMVPGHGIYDMPGLGPVVYPGSFIDDPHDGSQPSTWSLGADGLGVQSFMAAQSAADLAECSAIVWLWSETDSYRSYSEKVLFKPAAQQFMALERAMIPGATAANLPLIWWNAIPYGNTDGVQMHREVVAELAADPTQGVVIGNPMTADSNDRGAAWDPATGIQTGGDNQHRDTTDNQRFARLAAPIVARALQPLGRGDTFATMPSGIPVVGGQRITHAYRQDDSTVVLTIVHDAGNDLIVPLLAASGQGFVVMDGGSVASPGTLRPATACVRVDATHLSLTLASPLTNPSASCLLFYPYGSFSPSGTPSYTGDMGRGNAVYDNLAALAAPAGWDVGGDLGSAWSLNCPLAATSAPIVLSDSPGP